MQKIYIFGNGTDSRFVAEENIGKAKEWEGKWTQTDATSDPYCVLNPAWTFHDGATFTMYSNMILLLLLAKEGKIDAIHGLHRYRLFCDDTGNAPENGYTAFDLPAPDRSEIIEETLEYINWHRGMTILEAHGLKLPDPDTWPRIVLHVANPKEDPVWVAQGVHDAYLKCECDEDEANEWLCKIKAVMRNVENH